LRFTKLAIALLASILVFAALTYAGSNGGSLLKLGPFQDKLVSINVVGSKITCFYHGASTAGITSRTTFAMRRGTLPSRNFSFQVTHPFHDSRTFIELAAPVWAVAVGLFGVASILIVTFGLLKQWRRKFKGVG
jgi:hypothetical protein